MGLNTSTKPASVVSRVTSAEGEFKIWNIRMPLCLEPRSERCYFKLGTRGVMMRRIVTPGNNVSEPTVESCAVQSNLLFT